jgi:hypothetical protein
MEKQHKCQECHFLHYYPKKHRPVVFWLQAIVFSVIEILAARQIDGLLAVGLYAIAALNAIRTVVTVWALSVVAMDRTTAKGDS